AAHQLFAGIRLGEDKLLIAVAIRLLTISSKKILPPRPQVPGHVLDDERDAVGLRIRKMEEVPICKLDQSAISHTLVAAKGAKSFLKIVGGDGGIGRHQALRVLV